MGRRWRVAGWILLWVVGCTLGYPFQERVQIPAIRITQPPLIDGRLDDPCWSEAFAVRPFWQTERDAPFPFATTALVCYDARALYVGFQCADPQPSLIQAQQTKRGGLFAYDDYVEVLIDPADRPSLLTDDYFLFRVSAGGVQDEFLSGGSVKKAEWRGQWYAAVQKDGQGWSVEIAIPWSVLRISAQTTSIGVVLTRHVPPPRGVVGSFPYRLGVQANTTASLAPLYLEVPAARLKMMPLVTIDNRTSRVGLELKQTLRNGLTWNATIRPDFRTVQDVVETIDFTYTPRVLDDTRPFFVEGATYLPESPILYTRWISQIEGGVKVFGNLDRSALGLLSVYEGDGAWLGAVRWRYMPSRTATVEFQGADWTRGTGFPAWGVRCEWRLPQTDQKMWDLRAMWSQAGGEKVQLVIGQQPIVAQGRLGWGVTYERVSAYRPSAGFVPETHYTGWQLTVLSYHRLEETHPLHTRFFRTDALLRYHLDGRLREQFVSSMFHLTWRKGWMLTLTESWQYRPPFRDHWTTLDWRYNAFNLRRRGVITLIWGHRAGGTYRFGRIEQGIVVGRSFSLNMRYENLYHPAGVGRSTQWVISGVWELGHGRSIVGSWVSGYRPVAGAPQDRESVRNLYLGLRQVSEQGLDIALLFGMPNAQRTQNQILMQVAWVF